MAPPFALPPPDFPFPAYVRQADSGLLMPRKAVLPGLYMPPGFMGQTARPITSLSLVASFGNSNYSDNTITVPAGVRAGDLLVLSDYVVNKAPTPTDVTPSGWTQIATRTSGNARVSYSLKVATGSEGGTNISGITSDALPFFARTMLVLRGDAPIARATVQGVVSSGLTDNNPNPQTVTASGGTAPLVVLGFYNSLAAVSPRTMTPAKDGEAGNSESVSWIAFKFYASSPADVVVDMDNEGFNNCVTGCYVELRS